MILTAAAAAAGAAAATPAADTLPFFGEAAALATAMCFAICTLCFAFAGRRTDAQTVNLVRIVVACVLLTSVQFLVRGELWSDTTTDHQLTLLIVSGAVGLAFGDICLFSCLVRVGPRLGSLLMALAPALTAILALAFLDERLTLTQWAGLAIVTAGIGFVIRAGGGRNEWERGEHHSFGAGIGFGVLAALGQAGGLVLSKAGMQGGFEAPPSGDVVPMDPFSATVLRMIAGAVVTILFVVCARVPVRPIALIKTPVVRRWVVFGILTGPILGVWLSMVAVSSADAGIAATLMATTPILMIPISRIAYRAKPTGAAIVGTVIAVLGAVLLELGG